MLFPIVLFVQGENNDRVSFDSGKQNPFRVLSSDMEMFKFRRPSRWTQTLGHQDTDTLTVVFRVWFGSKASGDLQGPPVAAGRAKFGYLGDARSTCWHEPNNGDSLPEALSVEI